MGDKKRFSKPEMDTICSSWRVHLKDFVTRSYVHNADWHLLRVIPVLQVFPFPSKDETYKVPFTKTVYIEQDDFREQDNKKYFGLAPGKSVLLRYALHCAVTACCSKGTYIALSQLRMRVVRL